MAQSYPLGIQRIWQQLSVIQSSGLYWINIDRQTDAHLLCRQIISSQPADNLLAFICSGEDPDKILVPPLDLLLKKFPLYTLPEKKAALLHLKRDLIRALKPRNRLVILLAHAGLWKDFTSDELSSWVNDISAWLQRRQEAVIILSHGSGVNKLKNQLSVEHRALSGLASLQWQQDSAQYLVSWWRTADRIDADHVFTLTTHAQGWQGAEESTKTSLTAERNDENRFLAEQSILEGAPPLSNNWQLFEHKTELINHGMQTVAATLIFALHQTEEIDELAKQIHSLRCNRGSGLKIVVREMSSSLRYSDERLLLACGTNLIVPHVASLSSFLSMLESIHGQRLSRYIPSDINALFAGIRPMQLRGHQPLEAFSKAVIALMENTLLPEDGKGLLVALRPAQGLSANQALTLCHQRRFGDIVTVAQEQLFLFLSTCRINDLDTALKFIFSLPVREAFSNQVVWNQDVDITANIRLLLQNVELSLPTTQYASDVTETTTATVAETPLERREPTAITLLSHR